MPWLAEDVSAEANKWGNDSPGDDGESSCTSGCGRDVGFGGSGGGAGSRVIFHPLVSISLIDAQTDGIISWFFQSHPNMPGNMSRRSGMEGGSSSTFSKPTILLAELVSRSSLVGFTGGFLLIPSDTPTSRPCTSEVCASYYLARVDIGNVNKLTWINELVLVLTIQGTFMTYFFPSQGGDVGDIIYIVLHHAVSFLFKLPLYQTDAPVPSPLCLRIGLSTWKASICQCYPVQQSWFSVVSRKDIEMTESALKNFPTNSDKIDAHPVDDIQAFL